MGSGVIYAAIIVMWAAYFIPRWLRRHEELSESRSVEKFDQAMRILSRKETLPDQRYVVMPPRPKAPADRPHRGSGRSRLGRGARPARSAANLAVRRARVLAGLLLATALTLVATPFTSAPWWAGPVLVGVVLLDLAHLRVQARRRSELSRTRQAVRSRTRSRLRRFDSAERIVEARQSMAEERVAAEAARRAQQAAAVAEAERAAAVAAGWQPVPVPLPTYVTKPVAPPAAGAGRPPLHTDEPFDQTTPEARVPEPVKERRGLLADAERAADDLDEILERRRAVND